MIVALFPTRLVERCQKPLFVIEKNLAHSFLIVTVHLNAQHNEGEEHGLRLKKLKNTNFCIYIYIATYIDDNLDILNDLKTNVTISTDIRIYLQLYHFDVFEFIGYCLIATLSR